jgi:hypothetical protein
MCNDKSFTVTFSCIIYEAQAILGLFFPYDGYCSISIQTQYKKVITYR